MTQTGFFSLERRREFTKLVPIFGRDGESAESIFALMALGALPNPKGRTKGRTKGDSFNDLDSQERIKNVATSTDLKREYGFIDDLFQQNCGLAMKAFLERWTGTLQRNDSIWNGEELDMSKFYLARPVINFDKLALYSLIEARTKLHALKALVALRKWQLQHDGTLPTSLVEVMKASGYPVLPIYPFSNKPLLFAVINGKPIVYSVGPNGVDEQAKIESNFVLDQDANLNWKVTPMQSPGDFVFRIGN